MKTKHILILLGVFNMMAFAGDVKPETEEAKLERWHKLQESDDAKILKQLLNEVCADVMEREMNFVATIKAKDAENAELKQRLANGSAAYKQLQAENQRLAASSQQPAKTYVVTAPPTVDPQAARQRDELRRAVDSVETANNLKQVNDLLRQQALDQMQYDLHKIEMQNRFSR